MTRLLTERYRGIEVLEHPRESKVEVVFISVASNHLEELVGDETVAFLVDANRRVLVRRLDEAEDLSALVVVPVLEVLHAVLLLRLEILLVRSGDGVGRQTGNVIVDI